MLDQNTDRMWYVIGAVLIGAVIIFGFYTFMPSAFASVNDMFTDTADIITTRFNDERSGEDIWSDEQVVLLWERPELDTLRNWNGSELTLTTGHTVSEWGATNAVHVTVTGGTSGVKAVTTVLPIAEQVKGREYVYTVPIKNRGDHPIRVYSNGDGSYPLAKTVHPNESKVVTMRSRGNTFSHLQFQLRPSDDDQDHEVIDVLVGTLKFGYIKDGE